MTSKPFVRRTFATLRIAELGFLGVRVITWMHTPRRNGEFSKAGDLDLYLILFRPLRTNWLIVGICLKSISLCTVNFRQRNGAQKISNPIAPATTVSYTH